jgi:hypothetical protein
MKLALLSLMVLSLSCAASSSSENEPLTLDSESGLEEGVEEGSNAVDAAEDTLGAGGEVVAQEDVFFVKRINGVLNVVLSDRAVHSAGYGPLTIVEDSTDDGFVTVRRELDLESLPATLRTQLSSPIDIRTDDGHICHGSLTRPALYVQAYRSEEVDPVPEGEGADVARASSEDAARAWMSEEVQLTAEVVGCDEGLYAVTASQTSFEVLPADAATSKAALREFRGLMAYAQIGEDQTELTVPWDEYNGARPTVSTLRVGGREFVHVDAVAGSSCDGAGGDLQALFERKNGRFVHVQDFSMGDHANVYGISMRADGTLTLLYDSQMVRLPTVCTTGECEDTEVRIRNAGPRFFGCGC